MSKSQKQRNVEIVELYKSGQTLQKIGDVYGLSHERVRQILKEEGLAERRFWSKPKPVLTKEQKLLIKIAKFWSQVGIRRNIEECWFWHGFVYPIGYGKKRWNGRPDYSHRVAWEISNKQKPQGAIYHTCENRLCCNPAHLRHGTRAEAQQVAWRKSGNTRWRENLSKARYKVLANNPIPAYVGQIREMSQQGFQAKEIAAKVDVSITTVYAIRKGERWNQQHIELYKEESK